MKLGWFTPAWKSENQEKRAKALGRMDDEKLLEILRDKSDDTLMNTIRLEAIDCLSPAGLKEFVLDTSINGWLRGEAVKQIDDEDILFACAKDETMEWGRVYAVERMHTRERLVDLAMTTKLFTECFDRLRELDDWENLRYLALNAAKAGSNEAIDVVEAFEQDSDVLRRLASRAPSDYVRAGALLELKRQGLATEQMREDARTRARELIRSEKPDQSLIWNLLCAAGPGAELSAEERDFLCDHLRAAPFDYQCLDYLFRTGDPVGLAFMTFYRVLYEEEERRLLNEEDYARVLALDEDFALDYLLACIRVGGNGRLDGPRTVIAPCAEAIYRMHEAGKARERIERELPQTKEYHCIYSYQDSENYIRTDSIRFSVRFWE